MRRITNPAASNTDLHAAMQPGGTRQLGNQDHDSSEHRENAEDLGCTADGVQFAYNTATSSSTGHSPTYLNLGCELKPPGSLAHEVAAPDTEKWQHRIEKLHAALELARDQMAKSFQSQQKHYNLRRRRWAPEVGEKVLKQTHHLSSKTDHFNAKLPERNGGPYTVVKRITSVIFDLKDERGNTVWHAHVKDLKPLQGEAI